MLIVSARAGYGHHASALALQQELSRAAPGVATVVRNGLDGGGWARLYLERILRRQLLSFPRSYSWTFALLRTPGTHQLAMRLADRARARHLSALIAAERPNVIVSTYPGVTAVLGAMRRRGALAVPVCSLITDVAGLHFWTDPGIDLHLACYRESLQEIAAISRDAPAQQVSPPVARAHRHGRTRSACLRELELDPARPLVVVSGGGWGVGDLEGAARVAFSRQDVQIAVVCGQNGRLKRRLQSRYAGDHRVRVLGFTERMPELLAGASALIHSTGGVTCLEAAVHNCPVIAYGFGRGHLRENLRAMSGSGLLWHAVDCSDLGARLVQALASEHSDREATELPSASSQILALIDVRERQPLAVSAAQPKPVRAGPARRLLRSQAGLMCRRRRLARGAPWVLLLALLTTWVLWYPPSPDLAAQVYRVHLFQTDGFSLWDNSWYDGHYLPSYSLLLPAFAAFAGLRTIGALSALISVWAFSRLIRRFDLTRPDAARGLFVLGVAGDLFIGRIAFALGVAIGLLAVHASTRRTSYSHLLTVCLSLACAAASPVAAIFLALVACADWVVNRSTVRALALGGPALGLTGAFAVVLPEGGYEPFTTSSLLAASGASLCVLLLASPAHRLLRATFALYVLVLVGCYLVPSPVGSNADRFGVLFAPSMLVGCITSADVQARAASLTGMARHVGRATSHRAGELSGSIASTMLAICVALLVSWQLTGPLSQSIGASLSPSSRASFYDPVIRYVERADGGRPVRIEVPFTSSHWDATVLGAHFMLARGWERQLDTHYNRLFYESPLTAAAYRTWLLANGVRFVALSDAPLDYSSTQEAALIRSGLPYLHLSFQSRHWRIYVVRAAQPLLSGPGSLSSLNGDGFSLDARHGGRFVVRVHYTPYWSVQPESATVTSTPEGWTELYARGPGKIAVDAELSLGALGAAA